MSVPAAKLPMKQFGSSGFVLILLLSFGVPTLARAGQDAIPKVLIVQNSSKPFSADSSSTDGKKGDKKDSAATAAVPSLASDPDISEPLAESLAENGKVEPIVWSTADPVFRAAYQSNKIQWLGGDVTMDQAQAGARVLGCKGIIFVYGRKGEAANQKGIYFRAEMFTGSKSVWVFPSADQFPGSPVGPVRTLVYVPNKKKPGQDQTYRGEYRTITPKLTDKEKALLDLSNWMFMMEKSGSKVDDDNSLASIASTLTASLSQGPLMGLKVVPALTEQPMAAGIDKLISPQLPPTDVVSDETLSQKMATLLKSQSNEEAMNLAYRAVDESPLDPRRRELLLQTLNTLGRTSAAIDEAKSAAAAFGNSAPLLSAGAQIAFDGGEVDEAESMAVRAMAIDGNSELAKVVLGQVALAKGDLDSGNLPSVPFAADKVGLQKWVNFVLAQAMKGNSDWLNTNLGTHFNGLPPEVQQRVIFLLRTEYHRKADLFRKQLGQSAMTGTTAIGDLTSALNLESSQVAAEGLVAQALSTANPDQKPLLRAQIAFNLLHQCLQEVIAYIGGGRKGTLDDPQINFSESLHQMSLSEQPEETEPVVAPATSPDPSS